LIAKLSKGTQSGEMTNIARYANGHLFDMYSDERSALVEAIGSKLGGATKDDYANLDLFNQRMRNLSQFAKERNVLLYVDAE
jgi:hypothetical protein